MRNADKPVHPSNELVNDFNNHLGISKREHFAVLAMQAFISSRSEGTVPDAEKVARYSVEFADQLLKHLNQ